MDTVGFVLYNSAVPPRQSMPERIGRSVLVFLLEGVVWIHLHGQFNSTTIIGKVCERVAAGYTEALLQC